MSMDEPRLAAWKDLVQRLLEGPVPVGTDFDACRAVLQDDRSPEMAFEALCMLLEGALADATLPIEDTQEVVPLLKNLARGTVQPGDLL